MTQALNKQLHALLNSTQLMPQKAVLVTSFTNGRSDSSRDMSQYEAIELIQHLKSIQTQAQANTAPHPKHISQQLPTIKTDKERANTMRRKIIALAHNMGWSAKHPTSGNKIADMKRINDWCKKYGYLHIPLNDYTAAQLPKLVTQFDNLYKSFLKGI